MAKFFWVEYFDNWQSAAEFLNDLAWNLTWWEHDGRWHLWAGDQPIFVGDTEAELQAFVYGMALTLVVLPESILDQVREIANEE